MSDVARDEVYAQVLSIYRETESCAEVGRRLDIPQQTIWSWLHRAGDILPSKEERFAEAAMKDYLAGMSWQKVADKYGVSPTAVQGWAKKAQVYGQGGRNAKTRSGKAQAIEMYKQGRTYSEIARALKIQASTVWGWIESEGIQDEGGGKLAAERDAVETVVLYQGGATIETIAKHLGRSVNTVSRWLHAAGVEVLSSIERRTPEEQAEYARRGGAAMKQKAESNPGRICEHCKGEFKIPYGPKRASRQRYCSKACFGAARTDDDNKINYECEVCGESGERYKSATLNPKYCSRECYHKRTLKPSRYVVREQDMVLEGYEVIFLGLCQIFGIPCEQFNRDDVVSVEIDGSTYRYGPDFVVTLADGPLWVDPKGRVGERAQAKWEGWRNQRGRLAIVTKAHLDMLRKANAREFGELLVKISKGDI